MTGAATAEHEAVAPGDREPYTCKPTTRPVGWSPAPDTAAGTPAYDSHGNTTTLGTHPHLETGSCRSCPTHPVEGGSANDYDYVAGDPINNVDLDGTRCLTGVARRVQEERINPKTGEVEMKTREICRSVSRGAGRAARAFVDDPGKYFSQLSLIHI